MITTVTLNPAIDKVVEVGRVTLGEVHRISHQVMSLGGKSINVSRILTGLACDTEAICFAGQDNFSQIKGYADAEGIPLKAIQVAGLTRTNVKIIESHADYRTTDINEAGFDITKDQLDEMTHGIVQAAKVSEYVVLSGSLPGGVSKDYYKVLCKTLKPYTRVVVDADGEVLRLACEAGPYLIKPNIHELEAAYGVALKSHEDIIGLSRQLIEENGITYVVVSMGGDGSMLVSADMALYAEVLPVQVVSTVGAGDSMLAGVLYGLQTEGQDTREAVLKAALACGTASGAIAIGTKAHHMIEADTLLERARQVKMKVY